MRQNANHIDMLRCHAVLPGFGFRHSCEAILQKSQMKSHFAYVTLILLDSSAVISTGVEEEAGSHLCWSWPPDKILIHMMQC